jgi:NAD(P)-dependent dehydrogenase (short-subunit alcohol dehydrogenase family)
VSSAGGCRRFEGKVAIVTGASRDPSIGRATAARLGQEGAAVVLNARGETALNEAIAALGADGTRATGIPGDITDDLIASRLVDAALQEHGRIDVVVNTVGGSPFQGTPRSLDREGLRETIELNTWNVVAMVQAALEGGLADGGGSVVNISSGTVHKTTPRMIAYAAAKAALNAMTRTLAADLGPLGVRVNAVAPGLTRTWGTRSMWESDDGDAAGRNLLLGRLTRDTDIANACLFLASDDAAQITGQIVDVDGGNHLMGGGWSPMADPTADAGS